jgi:hypothetical protein
MWRVPGSLELCIGNEVWIQEGKNGPQKYKKTEDCIFFIIKTKGVFCAILKIFCGFLRQMYNFWPWKTWIRNWVRIRNETNADLQHCVSYIINVCKYDTRIWNILAKKVKGSVADSESASISEARSVSKWGIGSEYASKLKPGAVEAHRRAVEGL